MSQCPLSKKRKEEQTLSFSRAVQANKSTSSFDFCFGKESCSAYMSFPRFCPRSVMPMDKNVFHFFTSLLPPSVLLLWGDGALFLSVRWMAGRQPCPHCKTLPPALHSGKRRRKKSYQKQGGSKTRFTQKKYISGSFFKRHPVIRPWVWGNLSSSFTL